MAETRTLKITLTKEQALQLLVATGLMVNTLELPLDERLDPEEAVALIPLPEWVRQAIRTTEDEAT
jgi:hypothetical protein